MRAFGVETFELTLLLRMEEAANSLSVGRNTLLRLIKEGEIPVVKIGRSVRIPVSGLIAYVNRKQEAAE